MRHYDSSRSKSPLSLGVALSLPSRGDISPRESAHMRLAVHPGGGILISRPDGAAYAWTWGAGASLTVLLARAPTVFVTPALDRYVAWRQDIWSEPLVLRALRHAFASLLIGRAPQSSPMREMARWPDERGIRIPLPKPPIVFPSLPRWSSPTTIPLLSSPRDASLLPNHRIPPLH